MKKTAASRISDDTRILPVGNDHKEAANKRQDKISMWTKKIQIKLNESKSVMSRSLIPIPRNRHHAGKSTSKRKKRRA